MRILEITNRIDESEIIKLIKNIKRNIRIEQNKSKNHRKDYSDLKDKIRVVRIFSIEQVSISYVDNVIHCNLDN